MCLGPSSVKKDWGYGGALVHMVWVNCTSVNAKLILNYIYRFSSNICCHAGNVFPDYSSMMMSDILQVLQQHGSIVLSRPACSPDLPLIENFQEDSSWSSEFHTYRVVMQHGRKHAPVLTFLKCVAGIKFKMSSYFLQRKKTFPHLILCLCIFSVKSRLTCKSLCSVFIYIFQCHNLFFFLYLEGKPHELLQLLKMH